MSLPQFPFSALCGQPQLQTALLLAAIDPLIGGVLIEGPRGTAKSTSARALADLLPQGRFVNLPLGASEEQLVGSLNIESALREGRVDFKHGLLARAHQGVLYVDEVNLLADALVDLLLDVSVSGVNFVERDGISHQHEARIVLIGTMNPEEGALRPQLLDRFGLFVRLGDVVDTATRQRIVQSRLQFDRNPAVFLQQFSLPQQQLVKRLEAARALLPDIAFPDAVVERVNALCHAAAVEGVRADLAMLYAARAHVALNARTQIDASDIDAVAELVLSHRRRPQSDAPPASTPSSSPPSGNSGAPGTQPQEPSRSETSSSGPAEDWGELPPEHPPIQPVKKTKPLPSIESSCQDSVGKMMAQCATFLSSAHERGHHVSTRIHWPRTLSKKANLPLVREHLRFHHRAAQGNLLHCLVLDCSASMLQQQKLSLAKGLLLRWTQHIYRQRAELAVITFSGNHARIVQPPVRATAFNEKWISAITGGGATPVMPGVQLADRMLKQVRRNAPHKSIGLWLLTDGRFNAIPPRPTSADFCIIVNFENSNLPLHHASRIAAAWRAELVQMTGDR